MCCCAKIYIQSNNGFRARTKQLILWTITRNESLHSSLNIYYNNRFNCFIAASFCFNLLPISSLGHVCMHVFHSNCSLQKNQDEKQLLCLFYDLDSKFAVTISRTIAKLGDKVVDKHAMHLQIKIERGKKREQTQFKA